MIVKLVEDIALQTHDSKVAKVPSPSQKLPEILNLYEVAFCFIEAWIPERGRVPELRRDIWQR